MIKTASVLLSVQIAKICSFPVKREHKDIVLSKYETATLAGGCFWCMESFFQEQKGVVEVISGYAGGKEKNPSYEQVSSGITGHRESIQVFFNPKIITYEKIIELYWTQIDPTDTKGQFVDKGNQYTSAIFYHDKEQKNIAEESKRKLSESGRFDKPIVTEIIPFTSFYPAEDYHQDYYKKKLIQYKLYSVGSGRKEYQKKNWKS